MQIRKELVKSTETWSNFKQNEHQMTFTSEGILQKQVWHPQKWHPHCAETRDHQNWHPRLWNVVVNIYLYFTTNWTCKIYSIELSIHYNILINLRALICGRKQMKVDSTNLSRCRHLPAWWFGSLFIESSFPLQIKLEQRVSCIKGTLRKKENKQTPIKHTNNRSTPLFQ